MSGVNPPSSAAAARNYEATQSLKKSVQAAFDGIVPSSMPLTGNHGLSIAQIFYATFLVVMISYAAQWPIPLQYPHGLLSILNLSPWSLIKHIDV